MNVIVAFSCSGKTTFSKEQAKYIDFDVFRTGGAERLEIAKALARHFAKSMAENDKVYLMNTWQFRNLDLENCKDVNVLEIIVPGEKAFNAFIERWKKRDIDKLGVVRTKNLESYKRELQRALVFAKEMNEKYGIKIRYLKENEYLSDVLK